MTATEPPAEWRDVSSFSQLDKDRTPRTWEIRLDWLKVTVTRHIHYPEDAWVLQCRMLSGDHQLVSHEIEAAKTEALTALQGLLQPALAALQARLR